MTSRFGSPAALTQSPVTGVQTPATQTAATQAAFLQPVTGLTAPFIAPLAGSQVQQPGQAFLCRSGLVQPRTGPGIPLRGTHLLLGPGGAIIASLFSDTIDLNQLNGQQALVCGLDAGVIEGVQAIQVLFAVPLFVLPFLGLPFFL